MLKITILSFDVLVVISALAMNKFGKRYRLVQLDAKHIPTNEADCTFITLTSFTGRTESGKINLETAFIRFSSQTDCYYL